jgi:hypothetical protein
MKAFFFFLPTLALSTLACAQSLPPSVDLADPSTLVSTPTCVSQCETVYADCREQCGEDTTRAREEKPDLANAPGGECLDRCRSDAAQCKQDCSR